MTSEAMVRFIYHLDTFRHIRVQEELFSLVDIDAFICNSVDDMQGD